MFLCALMMSSARLANVPPRSSHCLDSLAIKDHASRHEAARDVRVPKDAQSDAPRFRDALGGKLPDATHAEQHQRDQYDNADGWPEVHPHNRDAVLHGLQRPDLAQENRVWHEEQIDPKP